MSKKKHEFITALSTTHCSWIKLKGSLVPKEHRNNINRNTDASVAFLHRTKFNHELNHWENTKILNKELSYN